MICMKTNVKRVHPKQTKQGSSGFVVCFMPISLEHDSSIQITRFFYLEVKLYKTHNGPALSLLPVSGERGLRNTLDQLFRPVTQSTHA